MYRIFVRILLILVLASCSQLPIRTTAIAPSPKERPALEDQKIILITGASRGIGKETALKLAERGHIVYASMRNIKEIECERDIPNLHVLSLDVTDDQSVSKAIKIIIDKEGRLDVLINNAGTAVFGPMETVSTEQAKRIFEVNFFGSMRLMQAVLPVMRHQANGLIINLSSTSGVRPSPSWDIYAASKFAIEGLSEAVAATVKGFGIDVVILEPGTTATNFMTESTELGSRLTKETKIYKSYLANSQKWMQDRLADGQNPKEVALVISSIVEGKNRHFRNQTSEKGSLTVSKKHVDPTGDESIAEQAKLINVLFKEELNAKVGSSYR